MNHFESEGQPQGLFNKSNSFLPFFRCSGHAENDLNGLNDWNSIFYRAVNFG